MELGAFFRQQRHDSGLTIDQVARDIVPASVLSRFERGESELNASDFLRVLVRLNGDVEYLQKTFIDLNRDRYFTIEMANGDELQARAWQHHYADLFKTTGWFYYRLAAIRFSVVADMYQQPHRETTPESFDVVVGYLNTIPDWGTFEINLMSTISVGLVDDQLTRITPNLLSVLAAKTASAGMRDRNSSFYDLVAACQGVALSMIRDHLYRDAKAVMEAVAKVPLEQNMILLYNQAKIRLRLAYHDDPTAEATEQMRQLADTWEGTQYDYFRATDWQSWQRFIGNEAAYRAQNQH